MEAIFGNSWAVFIGVTVCLAGFAAYMMGQALAQTWRPAWQAVGYSALLACASRFFSYALFEGTLLSLSGYLIDFVVILAISLLAYRLTLVTKMVNQYNWKISRAGPFHWKETEPSR